MQVHGTTDNASSTANTPALLLNSDGSLKTGTGTSADQVQGTAASGATDSGNPVKVGGVYNTTLPTLTNGQRGDVQLGSRGSVSVTLFAQNSTTSIGADATDSDGRAGSANAHALISQARGYSLNGAGTYDRNRSGIITPTATLTGHQNQLPWAIYNAAPTTRTEGQGGPLQATSSGALVLRPYAVPDRDWTYAAATGGISNTTTAVTIAPAVASLRNYLTGLQITAEALGAATELAIRDGAGGTVIWRTKIGTGGVTAGEPITFPTPLKSTANTLLEVVTLTASVTGAVFVNAQGYLAP